jgi:hypothetical protein
VRTLTLALEIAPTKRMRVCGKLDRLILFLSASALLRAAKQEPQMSTENNLESQFAISIFIVACLLQLLII